MLGVTIQPFRLVLSAYQAHITLEFQHMTLFRLKPSTPTYQLH